MISAIKEELIWLNTFKLFNPNLFLSTHPAPFSFRLLISQKNPTVHQDFCGLLFGYGNKKIVYFEHNRSAIVLPLSADWLTQSLIQVSYDLSQY